MFRLYQNSFPKYRRRCGNAGCGPVAGYLVTGVLLVFLWALPPAGDPALAAGLQQPTTLSQLPAVDPGLQAGLEQLVREQGLWRQIKELRLALGVLDLTDDRKPRYAALNGQHMMYAASLPKIAILLGAFVEVERGALELNQDLRRDLVQMIRYSDNSSATRVMDKVGRQRLIEILRADPYRLYDPAFGGGLWVGKAYAGEPAYQRDPLHKLSHGATVYQVLRFFYLLQRGELVAGQYRDEMKEILSRPGIRHKFVAGLAGKDDIAIYRKSGTWRRYHADAALVEANGHTYVIVGLASHPDGGDWLRQLAAPLHDLVVRELPGAARPLP